MVVGFVAGRAIIRVLGNQSPDRISRELEGLWLVFSVFVFANLDARLIH